MKTQLIITALLLVSFASQSQITNIKKESNSNEPCYAKAQKRAGSRFAEWECGLIAGVVDCNEKLELDEGSNTVISASGKKPFSGTCETCHQNGILERRVTFVNGKPNGIDTTRYKTGCIMVIRDHVQGVENGHWTYFHDSIEKPAWEMNYNVGQKNGPQIYFNKKGDTTKFETYNNGVLNGTKVTYGSNGKRTKQVSYVNGLFEGPFILYNKEGAITEELNYKAGKKNGVFTYYYDDGVLLRTENWTNDVKNGEFKTFYYEGNLQKSEIYKKGLREGYWEEFFPDQKNKRLALYKKDILIEEHVFDNLGREIKTFGGEAKKAEEDDAAPGAKPAKKGNKKKKEEPKKEEPVTPAPTESEPEGN